jgi:hypothetical protein
MSHSHTVLVVHEDPEIGAAFGDLLKQCDLTVINALGESFAVHVLNGDVRPCAVVVADDSASEALLERVATTGIPVVLIRPNGKRTNGLPPLDIVPPNDLMRLLDILRKHCAD